MTTTYFCPRSCAVATAATLILAGCSRQSDTTPPASSVTASNVTLTAAQRQSIHIATVAAATFHKTVDTTGTVDFDNDQATMILAPMSGPVSRLLVSLGEQVKADQPPLPLDRPMERPPRSSESRSPPDTATGG